jgi:hypothetical protein
MPLAEPKSHMSGGAEGLQLLAGFFMEKVSTS